LLELRKCPYSGAKRIALSEINMPFRYDTVISALVHDVVRGNNCFKAQNLGSLKFYIPASPMVAVSRFLYWMAADEVFGTHSHWATPSIQAEVMSTYSRLRLLSDISNKK
jgi:hypothetical protein